MHVVRKLCKKFACTITICVIKTFNVNFVFFTNSLRSMPTHDLGGILDVVAMRDD